MHTLEYNFINPVFAVIRHAFRFNEMSHTIERKKETIIIFFLSLFSKIFQHLAMPVLLSLWGQLECPTSYCQVRQVLVSALPERDLWGQTFRRYTNQCNFIQVSFLMLIFINKLLAIYFYFPFIRTKAFEERCWEREA